MCTQRQHQPIRCEDCERRRLVAQVVHLFDRIGDTALGHHLLVLRGGALKGLSHVDVLQRNYKNKEKQLINYRENLEVLNGQKNKRAIDGSSITNHGIMCLRQPDLPSSTVESSCVTLTASLSMRSCRELARR